MPYGLLISAGLNGLFLFLLIRSYIANGSLRNQNTELLKNATISQKQMEIAAAPPISPSDLADRMREGKL